jgi:orotate phosphoribosyltransferase
VVVDDVVTTGSTLGAAARALSVLDVSGVVGVTAARTQRQAAAPPCVLAAPREVGHFAQVSATTGR